MVFTWVVAAIFFLLGGLVLALPWKGLVAWVESLSGTTSGRYAALLLLPVFLLLGFVLLLFGPWDADACRALQDACLSRITAWQLPSEVAVALGLVGIIAVGRFGAPFLKRRRVSVGLLGNLPAELKARWETARAEAERRCGSELPPLSLVRSPGHLCHVKGVWAPRLYLSASLLRELDHEELVGALCHEMAHIKRGDLLLGPMLYLCHCMTFFMPTSRHCYRRYLEERERAADEWAIARTENPLALASALAKVAERGASRGEGLMERLHALLERGVLPRTALAGTERWAVVVLATFASLPFWLDAHHSLEAFGRDVLQLFGILG